MAEILATISCPGANHERIAAELPPSLVTEVLTGLSADRARTKFGCAKVLRRMSETRPELLYPHFAFFVGLLDHPNKIFQWEAISVLAHLAGVDSQNQFEAIFARYFAPIPGPVMITAGNVIKGAALIARARPDWADRIAAEVLKVSKARYQTAECRNVAIGHAIEALHLIFPLLRQPEPVLRFVKKQLDNSRPSTRHKASQFLRRRRSAACGEEVASGPTRGHDQGDVGKAQDQHGVRS